MSNVFWHLWHIFSINGVFSEYRIILQCIFPMFLTMRFRWSQGGQLDMEITVYFSNVFGLDHPFEPKSVELTVFHTIMKSSRSITKSEVQESVTKKGSQTHILGRKTKYFVRRNTKMT